MTNFQAIQAEIESILPKSPLDFELVHSRLTLKWAMQIKPSADEALKIAAIAHDIDRAITGITEKDLDNYSKIDKFKQEHADRSAQFISEILQNHQYPIEIIEKVRHLVSRHETGGDEESNVLMSADSLAYFEYNIPSYLNRYGEERTKEKIKFMYNRLAPAAKELIGAINFPDKYISSLVKKSII